MAPDGIVRRDLSGIQVPCIYDENKSVSWTQEVFLSGFGHVAGDKLLPKKTEEDE